MLSSYEGFQFNAMYHYIEKNLIKLTHYDETTKRAHSLQIAKAEENPKVELWWAQPRTCIRHQPTD